MNAPKKDKLTLPSFSIRKWMYLIVISICALMLAIQLFTLRYLVRYVESLYLHDMDVIMDGIATDVQKTFAETADSVEYLADHSKIKEYANTEDTETRFYRAFDQVKPIVQISTENLNLDYLLISDITGAWYRFVVGQDYLTSRGREQLNEYVGGIEDLTNTVLILDGTPFFATLKPVTVWENSYKRIGTVVALTQINEVRRVFDSYGTAQEMTILLHDGRNILLSNHTELEGLRLDDLPGNQEAMLEKSENIFPGSLHVMVRIPQSHVFPQRTSLIWILLGTGLLVLLTFLMMAAFVNSLIVRPFTQVIDETSALSDFGIGRRLTKTGVSHVDELVTEINGMLSRLEDSSRRIIATQQNLYEVELRQKEIQMYLLRNQIDRHFLFNSLISLRTLANQGENDKIKEVADGIAQLIRYTTSAAKEVNIFDEMTVVNRYISIQNIRFNNKFSPDIDVDDRLCEYKILRLLIQPLAENALIHGLEKKPSHCVLTLRGQLTENGVCIEVKDNGVGIPADRLARIQHNIREAGRMEIHSDLEGIALVNIQKRVQMAYGENFGLTLESEEGKYTCARLLLPAVRDE